MKWLALPLAALAGCAALPATDRPVASSAAVDVNDPGTITGSWRERRGRYNVSISFPPSLTLAATAGCWWTGGALVPIGTDRYRIDRYASPPPTDPCPAWRVGRAIAPFDRPEVTLVRRGLRLFASSQGQQVELVRLTLPDQTVRIEHLRGDWRLANSAGRPFAGRDSGTLTIGPAFALRGSCAFYITDGVVPLPGLIVNPRGSQFQRNGSPCPAPGAGDRLIEKADNAAFHYLPESDRIEARTADGQRYIFVRS